MIRRDYILRMIEEFIQMLSRIRSLQKDERIQEAGATLEEGVERLIGTNLEEAARLSDTELLARLIQREPFQAVREKTLILVSLLKEAGDIAAAEDRREASRIYYLKGLQLLLGDQARDELAESPDYVPKVDAFVIALEGEDLSLPTQAMLMRHYEQSGQFGKAEDTLYSMLEAEPSNSRLVDLGISFYERIKSQSDDALQAGNLPRTELATALLELRRKQAALAG